MKEICQLQIPQRRAGQRRNAIVELLERVQRRYPTLSKIQRKIADYLARDGITASFDSITELAGKIGVSEASLVRFAKQLGYKGYPSFRKELQDEFRAASGNVSRFRQAVTSIGDEGFPESLFQSDIELIEETRSKLTQAAVTEAVDRVVGARKILIVGFRAAFSLAYFLYFRFVRLRLDARLITVTGGTSLVEQLALLEKGDLVIALGFDELPRETRMTIDYARKHRIPVLGVTHTPTSEIARTSSLCLLGCRRPHRTQSLAASMSLLNVLAIAVAARNKPKALRALRRLDALEQSYLKVKRSPHD